MAPGTGAPVPRPRVFTTLGELLDWITFAPDPGLTVTALPTQGTSDRRTRDRRSARPLGGRL